MKHIKKFEARSTKYETISNDKNPNAQNNVLNFENLNLGFVSSFGFRISYFLVFMLSLLFLSSACHAADELKIGYVNFSVLFEDYYKTKKAEAELRKEADKKEEMIKKIRVEINNIRKKLGSGVLKQEEKDKQKGVLEQKALQLNRVIRESKRELEYKREKAIREIIKDIEAVIREYSEKMEYTLVIENRDLLYADKKLDITKHIEDLLKKKEIKESRK